MAGLPYTGCRVQKRNPAYNRKRIRSGVGDTETGLRKDLEKTKKLDF
jgi:hypothetical protein